MLELQRRIVDGAVVGGQSEVLLLLGGLYLSVLLLQAGLKYARDTYLNRIAEGITRLLRKRFAQIGLGPSIDNGIIQSVILSEAEKIGGFVSESIALPLLQAGIVVSVVCYMLVVEPVIAGVALVFLSPLDSTGRHVPTSFEPVVRGKITAGRELGETVLEGHRSPPVAEAGYHRLVERIYDLRIRFANIKHATKVLSALVNSLGLLGILMVGGWLVILGETEIGTIVAFMSGYDRMTAPARDLLNFYRRLSTMRIQYRLVRDASANA